MSMLTVTYLVLALAGSGYIAVSALLGHLAESFGVDHAAGGDGGGPTDSSYGTTGAGHGATSTTPVGASTFHFPFFSPLAVATLFGSLGAWGLIVKHGFEAGDGPSLAIALPLAAVTAYAVTYAAWRLVTASRATSAFSLTDLVGASGEVLTPIPAGGTGEVAATVGGQRFTGPAREAYGLAVPRGAPVTIVRVVGATLVVTAPAAGEGARP
jgi:membrane protein implicated in regulation of membrane protease activity